MTLPVDAIKSHLAATLVLVGFYFLVLKDKRGIFMFAKGLLFGNVAYGMYILPTAPWCSWTMILMGFYFLVLKDGKNQLAKGLVFGTVAYGVYNLNKKNANLSGTMLIADTALGAIIVGVLGHLMLLFTLVLNGCSSSGSGSGSDCLLDLSFCKICSMLRLSTRLDARNNL